MQPPWERIRPLVAQDFEGRDGRLLAAQWQACLDDDSSDLRPRCTVPIHAIAFSHDVQTPPARVREVAELAPAGASTCSRASATGPRSATGPTS